MSVKSKAKKSSLAKRNLERFMKNKAAVIGAVVLIIMVLACIFAPLLTPWDANYVDPTIRNLPSSAEHLLGTDSAGRDIFARLLYGGRISILIGIGCALGSGLLGTVLGCIAGYYGGKVDAILVAVQEFISIFPSVLLIMLFVAFFKVNSIGVLMFILILTNWQNPMRVVRSRILSLKQEPYIESCRANGIKNRSIMFHHLLPNTLGPVIVNMTMLVAGFILTEAGMSYLGLGVPANVATWGNIINAAKRLDIVQTKPALWIAPGLCIGIFSLCVNLFGDGLRDALDPTAQ